MKTIHEKISEINRYFVDKILNEDFEIIKISTATIEIKIDGYRFNLWMLNEYPDLTASDKFISFALSALVFIEMDRILNF